MPRLFVEKLREPGAAGKKELWLDWFKAEGDWAKVKVMQRKKISAKVKAEDIWGFRMKCDILDLFKGDVVFVNKLCSDKIKTGLWKKNPEAPDREDMQQSNNLLNKQQQNLC